MTREDCECDVLRRAAQEPGHPVEFDERLNEFSIKWSTGNGTGSQRLRYCFWCGGRLGSSRRDKLFHTITAVERDRLTKLTEGIGSIEEAVSRLGTPDDDRANGYGFTNPERNGKPEQARSYRMLVFEKHSDTASIHLIDLQEKGVAFSFVTKPLDEA